MNTSIAARPLRRRGQAAAAALLAAPALTVPAAFTSSGASAAAATDDPTTAKVVAEEQVGPRLVDLTIQSPALGGTEQVRLLTPDGWEHRQPDDTWPVVYLLEGGGGDHDAWTNDSDLAELPELQDTLVVMPGMPLFGFYTDWDNHGAGGPPAVETFHLDELRPLLERDYGAGNRRVVAGLSQGGYGALAYAAHHPGMFAAAASYSGWTHPHQHPDLVFASAELAGTLLQGEPIDGTAIWGDPIAQRHNWEAGDPFYLADRLTGTPVYLASGDGTIGDLDPPDLQPEETYPELDQFGQDAGEDVVDPTEALMHASSQAVAKRLEAAGVPLTTHFYPGTHSWPYWQRELHNSLPMLLEALYADRGAARVAHANQATPGRHLGEVPAATPLPR